MTIICSLNLLMALVFNTFDNPISDITKNVSITKTQVSPQRSLKVT